MKKVLLILIFSLLIISDAYAHGGRVDSCGGHQNKKTGSYHIHNYTKHCKCYPHTEICNKNKAKQTKNESTEVNDKITIYVKNTALTLNRIQVRDAVCKDDLPEKCKYAKTAVRKCKEDKDVSAGCKEAKSTIKSAECISGLVYDGWVESKEKVELSVCVNYSGRGRVSVRAVNKTSGWHHKFMLSNGDTVNHQ